MKRSACTQGHLDAAYQLGVMYLAGWGEKANRNQATYFWALAAKFGHVLAMYNLAMLHLSDPCALLLLLLLPSLLRSRV